MKARYIIRTAVFLVLLLLSPLLRDECEYAVGFWHGAQGEIHDEHDSPLGRGWHAGSVMFNRQVEYEAEKAGLPLARLGNGGKG